MQIDVRSCPLEVSNPGGNATTSSITVPVPTVTLPSGDGFIQMGQGGATQGGSAPSGIKIIPYGVGSAGLIFSLGVYGWSEVNSGLGNTLLWTPHLLAQFNCTLGAVPGIAGTDVNASQLFCNTIALAVGNGNVSNEIISPTGTSIAHCIVNSKGCRFLQLLFGTGGSATSANALVATL